MEENIERIHAWLRRELSEEEQTRFEDALLSSPELQQQVKEERDWLLAMRYGAKHHLPLLEERRRKRHRRVRMMRICVASAVAAMLLLGFVISPLSKSQHLYRTHLSSLPPKGMDHQRTSGAADDGLYRHFCNQEYEQAIALETALQPADSASQAHRALLLGLAHLHLGNGQQALDAFRAPQSSSMAQQWHIALALVSMGQLSEAEKVLEEALAAFPSSDSVDRQYREQALALQRQLSRPDYFFLYW
jgi:tetratricopeptide (TPR) repeat protein